MCKPIYLFLIVKAVSLPLSLLTLLYAFEPVQDRVIHMLSYENQPLKIVDLKVAEESVERDRPFIAYGHWLMKLSWKIENLSDKPIVYTETLLDFHEMGSSEGESTYILRHGQEPDSSGSDRGPMLLIPNESIRLGLSMQDYSDLQRFIEPRMMIKDIVVIEMKLVKVIFQDGTMWNSGRYYGQKHHD